MSLLLHFILALKRLLSQPLGLLPQLLGHLLVAALGRASHGRDPRHLQLKLLVLVVVVCDVDDARCLLDALF